MTALSFAWNPLLCLPIVLAISSTLFLSCYPVAAILSDIKTQLLQLSKED